MAYTINDVSKLTGLSHKTLRHYDKIDLLVPKRQEENQYRLYDDNDINKLQQIMFYKELDFSLKQIKTVIKQNGDNTEKLLIQQIEQLHQKIKRLNNITNLAEKTLRNIKGEIFMKKEEKFEVFKEKLIVENDKKFGKEVKEKYGEDTYNASVEKVRSLTEKQHNYLEQLSNDVNNAFIVALNTNNPNSLEAIKAVELHKKWLMHYWKEFNPEAYAGLANTYVNDPRFASYYDKLGKGMTIFIRDSILAYLSITR